MEGPPVKRYRFDIIFAATLVVFFIGFCAWHSPWQGKLTQEEINHYMAIIEKLPLPQEEIQAITSRLRPWAEADDGKPVYMFNLIRFFPQVRTFPGAPEFKGTPQEANAYYEKGVTWLWLSHASYPTFSGPAQARNLINIQPERTWNKVTIARYPNRRTFLRLLSDPAYAPMEPYKFIAMELDLVPASGGMVIPDLRWLVGGGLVMIFLLVGWIRAERRQRVAS
jgi:hypothetical protein